MTNTAPRYGDLGEYLGFGTAMLVFFTIFYFISSRVSGFMSGVNYYQMMAALLGLYLARIVQLEVAKK